MKKSLTDLMIVLMGMSLISGSADCYGQSSRSVERKYMTRLPSGKPEENDRLQKYRMTAVYKNMDVYGNFTGKTMVAGDYTRGYKGGYARWNNVSVSDSKDEKEPFNQGRKQEFMENFRYIPSTGMMNESDFKAFPKSIDNIFARNLIWDMLSVELFAWRYNDSLKLNRVFTLPDIKGEFDMADIGKYNHESIQLCWTGISMLNNQLCAVIEYRSLNNKISIALGTVKTKGTEQYWGNTWISLTTREIEYAEIYSSTFQEVQVPELKDKMLTKTIRELTVERIK